MSARNQTCVITGVLPDIRYTPLVKLNNMLSDPSFICHSGLTTLKTEMCTHLEALDMSVGTI